MFQVISQGEVKDLGPHRKFALEYISYQPGDLGSGSTSEVLFATAAERSYFIQVMELREQVGSLAGQLEKYKEAEQLREEKRKKREKRRWDLGGVAMA